MNFGTAEIKIHIYAGDHNPPHCHVVRRGVETRVAIPSLTILSGPELTSKERQMVIQRMDVLCTEFEKHNPNHYKRKRK